MKDLYIKIKELICDNYKGTLTDTTLDIITVSIMALYIQSPEIIINKMPTILNKIDIIAGDDKVSNYILKKYPNYPWNPSMDSESAMVVRALNMESKPVEEDWTMSVSTSKITTDPATVIAKTIHELTHLLRFGGIEETKREITVNDGICENRIDKKKGKNTKDNYFFEEGIVERHTKKTIDNFYEYLTSESDLSFSPVLKNLKNKFNGDFKNSYILEVSLIEQLCENERVKEIIDETFKSTSASKELITYCDSVLGMRGGFSLISNNLDRIAECINKDDIRGAFRIIDGLKPAISKIKDAKGNVKKYN